MKKKMVGIIICMLVLTPALSVVGSENNVKIDSEKDSTGTATNGEWYLQWTYKYNLNMQGGTDPIGDIDEDGINEIIVCGGGSFQILSYDEGAATYIEEYVWGLPGLQTAVCILDLDNNGDLEFCTSLTLSSNNAIYAWDWDGTTLTQLGIYNGTGVDATWAAIACDYDEDGDVELIIGTEPASGPLESHVTALGWDNVNDEFIEEAIYLFTGYETKESTVGYGDTDNDGHEEIIVTLTYGSVSNTGTWALNWNTTSGQWEEDVISTNYPNSTPLSIAVGDVNGNGIPEIAIGNYVGVTAAWVYEWNGATYEEIWYKQYPGEQRVHYAIDIGDADNDGKDELCIATNQVHIYQWNESDYTEEALLTDPGGSCSWVNIGDCDSDGLNELKTSVYLPDGSEYIYKCSPEPNNPPSIPDINGPTTVKRGKEINYTFISTDPEGQDVQFYIDWGDLTYDQWNGTYSSGEEVIKSHTWTQKATATIKAKAQDSEGLESDWGTLEITIPKYTSVMYNHFQNLIDFIRNGMLRLRHFLTMINDLG